MLEKRNTTTDLFKYVAAAMVVAIHTMRTFGTDSIFGFFIINVLCRIAVPFFCSMLWLFSFLKLQTRRA